MLYCVYNSKYTERVIELPMDKNQAQRIAEFTSLFLALDESGQEKALDILRSLDFAQSTIHSLPDGAPSCEANDETACGLTEMPE